MKEEMVTLNNEKDANRNNLVPVLLASVLKIGGEVKVYAREIEGKFLKVKFVVGTEDTIGGDKETYFKVKVEESSREEMRRETPMIIVPGESGV